MATFIKINEREIYRIVENVVRTVLKENGMKPSEKEYRYALANIDNARTVNEYDFYKNIIDRYEKDENLYWDLSKLSSEQELKGMSTNSDYLMTNGKVVHLHNHDSVRSIGNGNLNKTKLLDMGNIRLIGSFNDDTIEMELSQAPNDKQKQFLFRLLPTCHGYVYIDITKNGNLLKTFEFDRTKVGADFIINSIEKSF